jgi:hypothetical protein
MDDTLRVPLTAAWLRDPTAATAVRDDPTRFADAAAAARPFLLWCIRRAGLAQTPPPVSLGYPTWLDAAVEELWLALRRYDPARGQPTTWLVPAIVHHLRMLAGQRPGRPARPAPLSLDAPPTPDGPALGAMLRAEGPDALAGVLTRLDWQRWLAQQTPDTRRFLAVLATTGHPVRAARQLGVSPQAVYHRRQRLRAAWRAWQAASATSPRCACRSTRRSSGCRPSPV